jgi:hypothetical protein
MVNSAEIFYNRLTTRTKRVAAKSIAAIPAESIPVSGIGILIADTGYELYATCETIRDLDQLYVDLGMADDVMHSVCDPALPDAGDVWGGIVEKSGEWLEQGRPYKNCLRNFGAFAPDCSRSWRRT